MTRFNPTTYCSFGSRSMGRLNFVVKFSGLFPPVLTEKDDKTISLSIILEIEIVFEEFLMLGSVDNSLFQEKIKNFNSSVSDFSIRIPSKNGANDDLKFFEEVLWGWRKNGWIRLFFFSIPSPFLSIFC